MGTPNISGRTRPRDPLPYPGARAHRSPAGRPPRSRALSRAAGCSVAPSPRRARTQPSRCCRPSASPASATWPAGFETRPGLRREGKQKGLREETPAQRGTGAPSWGHLGPRPFSWLTGLVMLGDRDQFPPRFPRMTKQNQSIPQCVKKSIFTLMGAAHQGNGLF